MITWHNSTSYLAVTAKFDTIIGRVRYTLKYQFLLNTLRYCTGFLGRHVSKFYIKDPVCFFFGGGRWGQQPLEVTTEPSEKCYFKKNLQ